MPNLLSKSSTAELGRRRFKNELGQSQAGGSVLMVPYRDCLSTGTQGEEAGLFQNTAHAGTLVMFLGNTAEWPGQSCTSNILLFMPGDTSLTAHSISQNILVNKTIFFLSPPKSKVFFAG